MSKMRRIYHPHMNEYRDIPASNADSWKASGWRMTNPGHVTAREGLDGPARAVTDTFPTRVGDNPGVETIPTLETVTPATPK